MLIGFCLVKSESLKGPNPSTLKSLFSLDFFIKLIFCGCRSTDAHKNPLAACVAQ